MRRAASSLWHNVGFVAVLCVALYCVVHAFDPPRLNWGDSGADYNVMESGRNFARVGFLKLHLTAYLMEPQYITRVDRQFVYTHYPQLPDLMNGVERTVLHLSTLTEFRFVALAFMFASLVFFYRLIEAYWDRTTAQVALALWVTDPLWIQHADYLHHIPYLFFFGFGAFYFLDRHLRGGSRRFLALAGVFLFFTFFASYDYWFFAPIVATLMVLRARGVSRSSLLPLTVLGACAAAAVVAKFATNIWGLGGLVPFLADLHFQYVERGTSAITGLDSRAAAWPTFRGRILRYFTLLLYPVALVWLVLPLARRRLIRWWPALERRMPNPWWLLVAAVPFLAVFVDMWVGQMYPSLLVLPFFVIAVGALASLMFATGNRGVRVLAVGLVVAILGNSLFQNATYPKAVVPYRTIDSLRTVLDQVSVPGQYLVTNHVFDGFYRYYFDRNIWEVIVVPPRSMPGTLLSYVRNPIQTRTAGPRGVIYVQQKHVSDQMFDKYDYPIIAQTRWWDAWGNPNRYRRAIAHEIDTRDVLLTEIVRALHGTKLAETSAYVVWSLPYQSAPAFR